MEEYGTMQEEGLTGQQSTDEIVIGDLSNVPDGPTLMPATNNVLLEVTKAESVGTGWKMLKLTFKLVKGINEEGKYKGSRVSNGNPITYFVNPEAVSKKGGLYGDLEMVKDQSYMKDFKLTFVGTKRGQRELPPVFSVEQPIKVNDAFMESLVGQQCLGNIVQIEDDYQGPMNVVKFLKPVPEESMV